MAARSRSASNPPSSDASRRRCCCVPAACRLTHPPDEAGHDTSQPLAPGMLASHYAPRTPVRLNAVSVEAGEALLAFGEGVVAGVDATTVTMNLSAQGDLNEAAANLFGYLRALDPQRARA